MEHAWESAEARARAAERFETALAEAERFFMGEGRVHKALHKLCAELNEAHVPYAIAGALALNA